MSEEKELEELKPDEGPISKSINDLIAELEANSRPATFTVKLFGCEMPFRYPEDSREPDVYRRKAWEFARRMSKPSELPPPYQEALKLRDMGPGDFINAYTLHYWSSAGQNGGKISEVQALKLVAKSPGAFAGLIQIIEAAMLDGAVMEVRNDVVAAKKNLPPTTGSGSDGKQPSSSSEKPQTKWTKKP